MDKINMDNFPEELIGEMKNILNNLTLSNDDKEKILYHSKKMAIEYDELKKRRIVSLYEDFMKKLDSIDEEVVNYPIVPKKHWMDTFTYSGEGIAGELCDNVIKFVKDGTPELIRDYQDLDSILTAYNIWSSVNGRKEIINISVMRNVLRLLGVDKKERSGKICYKLLS